MQAIDALWFVAIFSVSALVIFAQADWRLACPLALWILAYVGALGYFVPQIRRRSEDLAHRRATVTGRIVDSYANVQTVKLFAHLEREDQHAREALTEHLGSFQRQTRLITALNATVSVLNSVLIVGTGSLAIELWIRGAVTLGDIALAAGLAIRIANMSGWIMWVSIGIFDNVGQVQEGMRTIARPHGLVDAPAAPALLAGRGGIRFENVRFHYGKQGGVIDDLSLRSRRARRSASSAARAPASRRWSICCCASTTSRPGASSSTARTSPRSPRTACASRSAW